jgi:hypothetical protein
MKLSELGRRMAEAGAPVEAILIALEALEACAAADAERRAQGAARKRRQRERDSLVTVTGQSRDSHGPVTGPLPPDKEVPPDPLKKLTLTLTPSPPKGGSVPKKISRFEDFWRCYPRKVGKGTARRAYQRALPKIVQGDPHEVLMAALAAIKPSWTDPEFVPHPSTWLKGERWGDGAGPSPIVVEAMLTPVEQAARDEKWAAYMDLLITAEEARNAQ